MKLKTLTLGALICAASLTASMAEAQTVDDRSVSVSERDRPEYDAVGARAGAFMVFPSASAGLGYDNDVFATDLVSEESGFVSYGLDLEGESLWSRHNATFNIGLDGRAYSDVEDESYTDAYAFGGLLLEASRDTTFNLNAGYEHRNEPRTSNNTTVANSLLLTNERIQFDRLTLGAGATRVFNRLRVIGDTSFTKLDYDSATLVGGGVSNQNVRDRDVTRFSVRGDYAVSPDTSLFLAGAVNERSYDNAPAIPTQERSSDGYEIAAGVRMRLTNLMQGEFFLGYQSQDYDGSAFPDIDGLDYGVNLDWFVSRLTTIKFEASSSIEESAVAGSAGFIAQTASVGVEREFRRNIIGTARAFVEADDFEGIAREDERFGVEGRMDYLVNRSVSFFGAVEYADQSSNTIGNAYDRTVLRIGLVLHR